MDPIIITDEHFHRTVPLTGNRTGVVAADRANDLTLVVHDDPSNPDSDITEFSGPIQLHRAGPDRFEVVAGHQRTVRKALSEDAHHEYFKQIRRNAPGYFG